MAENIYAQMEAADSGASSAPNVYAELEKPDPGAMSDFAHGVKAGGLDLPKMAADSGAAIGRGLSAVGLDTLGSAVQQKLESWSDEYAKSQAADPSQQQNIHGAEGGFIRRNMYALGKGVGNIGATAAASAVAAGTVGAVAGPEGAVAGFAGGAVWGAVRGMSVVLPTLFGLSTGEDTAKGVEKAQLAQGATQQDATNTANGYGLATGVTMGLAEAALTKIGMGDLAKPYLSRLFGATEGNLVQSVFAPTGKQIAKDIGMSGAKAAGIMAGQTDAVEAINQQGGYGDGPSWQGTADSLFQGGLIGGSMHAATTPKRVFNASATAKLLADPETPQKVREGAAIGAGAMLATRSPELAEAFGAYADAQIAAKKPIEIGDDSMYMDFAKQAKDDAAAQAQADSRTTADQYPSFTPTGDEVVRPSGFVGPNAPIQDNTGLPPKGFATAAAEPIPSSTGIYGGISNAPERSMPETKDIIAGTQDILQQPSIDAAIDATARVTGGSAQKLTDAVNAIGIHAGVITPEGAEMTPSPEALMGERTYFQDQRDEAARDQAHAAQEAAQQAAAPAAPADPYAARQEQLAAAEQAQRDAAQQQMHRDQLAQQADTAQQVSTANEQPGKGAVPTDAGSAAPRVALDAMSPGMRVMMERTTAKLESGGKITTAELGLLAQHHPDPKIADYAQSLLETRRNKDIVAPAAEPTGARSMEAAETIGGRPGVTTLDAQGGMSQGEGMPTFAAKQKQKQAKITVEAPTVAAPTVDPRVQPLQNAVTSREAATTGGKSTSTVEYVDPTTLPEKRTATKVDGGLDAQTLSKKEFKLIQRIASVFGKEVVLFRQKGGDGRFHANGYVESEASPKRIYINADAAGGYHHLTILGHEMAHQMRRTAPELFHKMRSTLLEGQDGSKAHGFLEELLGRKLTAEQFKEFLTDKRHADWATEEWVADLVGNRFTEYGTWKQVFGSIGKGDRGLVYRIADFITKFIDHLLEFGGFKKFEGTDEMVKDLQATRHAIRRGLAEWAQMEGGKAMQHEADTLRARMENSRAKTEPTKLVEPVADPRADVGKPIDRRAPAPVAERDTTAVQGSGEREPMRGPKREASESPSKDEVARQIRSQDSTKAELDEAEATALTTAGKETNARNEAQKDADVRALDVVAKDTALEREAKARDEAKAQAKAEKKAKQDAFNEELRQERAEKKEREQQREAERKAKIAESMRKVARERYNVDPERDSLMTAVAKMGGINAAEVKSQIGRSGKEAGWAHGIMRAVTTKGRTVDDMAHMLQEHGYLTSDDPHKELLDKLDDGLNDVHHYTDDAEYRMRREDANEAELDQQRSADEATAQLPEETQQLVKEERDNGAFTPAEESQLADHYDQLHPEELERADAEHEYFGHDAEGSGVAEENRASESAGAEERDARTSAAQPGEARGREETEAEREARLEREAIQSEGEGQDDFQLNGESQAEGRARLEREQAARDARDAADKAADRKAEGDSMRDGFELRGSDREADDPGQHGLFKRATFFGDDLDDAQREAIGNVVHTSDPIKMAKEALAQGKRLVTKPVDTLLEYKNGLGKRLEQGIAHRYAAIRDVSKQGFMQARLARGSDGALEAMLMYGKIHVDKNGVYDVKAEKDGGFAKVLAKLNGEHNRFFLWIAAHRAEELTTQERERLFGKADIDALKTLNKGREAAFDEALKGYTEYNNSILDVAVKSGLIDKATRDEMAARMYVPFYRVLDDLDGSAGPRNVSGLVNQYFSKKLKGGENKLNADLLGNVMQNWSHILGASARNRAAKTTLDAAESMGIAEKYDHPSQAPKGAVKVMIDGKKVAYAVHDQHLLNAVSAMYAEVPKWMKHLSTFKHLLTFGVTVMPGFKIRNVIRDAISTVALDARAGKNPLMNTIEGAKALRDDQFRASMLASGGIIRFGNMVQDGHAASTHRLIMSGVPSHSILDSAAKRNAFLKGVQDKWHAYQELGDLSENANRAGLYQRMIDAGHSHAEAAFAARDLLDFSDGGTNAAVQFLVQSIPFLNARIQGIFKLGSAAMDPATRKRFLATAGAVSMASLALMLAYQDDPDFKAREEFDRDNYWWAKVGGEAIRIPKPFELGAIGTVAEHMWELADPSNKRMTGSVFMHDVGKLIGSQFNIDYVPQIVKPFSDVYANRDSFTERPIESTAMQKLRPQDRYDANTSMTARFLSQLGLPDPKKLVTNSTYERLSPVQWDAILKGYFGGLGQTIIGMADGVIRPMAGEPQTKPYLDGDTLAKNLSMGFVQSVPSQQTRYMTDFYGNLRDIEQAYNSYHMLLKTGRRDEARAMFADNKTLISLYSMAESAKRQESQFGLMEKRIMNSTTMDAETKQERIKAINERRNQLAERMYERILQRQQ